MDLFNDTQQFFMAMDSRESLFFLISCLVVFILGFLIAYLLRSATLRRVRRDLRDAETARLNAETDLLQLQKKHLKLGEELETTSREKVDLLERNQRLDRDKKEQNTEIYRLNEEVERLQSAHKSYAVTIDEQNDRITDLQTRNNKLIDEANRGLEQPSFVVGSNVPGDVPVTDDQSNGGTGSGRMEQRLTALESRLDTLAAENDRLENRIAQLGGGTKPGFVVGNLGNNSNNNLPAEDHDTTDHDEPTIIRADLREPGIITDASGDPEIVIDSSRSLQVDSIIVPEGQTDDLTKIQVLGPFLQQKLNGIGVFTFDQIAAWDEQRIEEVTHAIQFIPGRIQKDDWVGQAAKLAAERPVKEYEAASFRHDDLKMVEGIGPKIEQVLNNNDVHTWEQLSGLDPDDIKGMLIQAGDQFNAHDPGTWPRQSALARDGQWEELHELQLQLRGGRN